MPSFRYTALTSTGESVAADLDAADQAAAVRELAQRGISVVDIKPHAAGLTAWVGRREVGSRLRVGTKRLAYLTRQLSVSLEAGLPLLTALGVMRSELDHAPSRELLQRLADRVQHGESLSAALAEHPQIFPPLYVTLVQVGETGGILEQVLAQLADMLERQLELRERIRSASIYPAVLLAVGLISVAIIVTVIVPSILDAISADPRLLPWPTRVLMATSDFVGRSGAWLLVLVVAAVVAARFALRRPNVRHAVDGVKLRVPIWGRLIRQRETARFARSLGILTRGGVTITEALGVVTETLENAPIRAAVRRLADDIRGGKSLSRPLAQSGLFPALLVQMVRVGENTGRLDDMLLRAAAVHESEARVTLDRIVNILPVAMILALACVIGFIVAGLVLAIVEFQTTGFGALGG